MTRSIRQSYAREVQAIYRSIPRRTTEVKEALPLQVVVSRGPCEGAKSCAELLCGVLTAPRTYMLDLLSILCRTSSILCADIVIRLNKSQSVRGLRLLHTI